MTSVIQSNCPESLVFILFKLVSFKELTFQFHIVISGFKDV